ncbi:MAG: metal-dependent transcriptional regulator [Methanomassiliicoccales archaeon]
MVSENIEEYLETIWELTQRGGPAKTTDIASELKVSPASVTEMIQKLAEEGYVLYEKYKGVTLTEEGNRIGAKIKRRHRLLERFLVDILGVSNEKSHEEACKLEHTISDVSEKSLCQMMNNPQTSPKGKPIPKCENNCLDCIGEPTISMSMLKPGEAGLITHLKCNESAKVRRIISMGFVPGRKVCVEEELPMGGPILVSMEESRIALAREYAAMVFVQKAGTCGRERGNPQARVV